MTCPSRNLDAAYVLGALPAGEEAAYAVHLRGCASCAASVQAISGIPALLARVPEDVLAGLGPSPPLPHSVVPELLRRVRRDRRRSRTPPLP